MALVYSKQMDEKTSFALWEIDESAEELLSQLQLKDHETAYLATLNEGKRHLHWLSTRVLLRKMLGDPAYIATEIDEHGKPFLTNFPHHISLSHSFDYAAVMISEDKEVGIDIEQIKTKIERIADKFLKNSEMEFINKSCKVEQLYACWCAKEAIYKLQGKKNVSFKNNIHLHPFDFNGEGVFNATLEINGISRVFDIHYEMFDDYMIGYCAANEYGKVTPVGSIGRLADR